MNRHMATEDLIRRAAEAIAGADALLIGAGAGMGVDSGLPDFRGPQGFWKAYPPYARLGLGFADAGRPPLVPRRPGPGLGLLRPPPATSTAAPGRTPGSRCSDAGPAACPGAGSSTRRTSMASSSAPVSTPTGSSRPTGRSTGCSARGVRGRGSSRPTRTRSTSTRRRCGRGGRCPRARGAAPGPAQHPDVRRRDWDDSAAEAQGARFRGWLAVIRPQPGSAYSRCSVSAGGYRAAEAAGMEKARYWLDAINLTARADRSGRCAAIRGAAAAGNRACDVHRPGAAVPGRTRRRAQSARV